MSSKCPTKTNLDTCIEIADFSVIAMACVCDQIF